VHNKDEVLDTLIFKLFQLPVTDFGRHLLLISIIGELCHPKAVEPLIKFINTKGEHIVPSHRNNSDDKIKTSFLDYSAALQARAVEMLAFIKTAESLTAVLHFVSNHSSLAVRLAAMDAFVYNHNDNIESIEKVRQVARADEVKMVGLTRFECNCDIKDFNTKLSTFYKNNKEEIPPIPKHLLGEPPTERKEITENKNSNYYYSE
jgi:hypothetical protein